MNYIFDGKNYIANDGYVFEHKITQYLCKCFRKTKFNSIDNYNVIKEPLSPVSEEEPFEYEKEENVNKNIDKE